MPFAVRGGDAEHAALLVRCVVGEGVLRAGDA